MMHVLIAARPDYRWEARLREHPTVAWSPLATGNRLQRVVEQALATMFGVTPTADLTFSTRPADEVMADLIETPAQLATGAPGCSIEVFCREGRLDTPDDRWARVHRMPDRSAPCSFGLADVFRPQTLRAQIEGWFEKRGWQTFGPPRPHRNEAAAPPYGRELLVRHGDAWRARRICPGDFPVFRPWPTKTAQAPVA